MDLNPANTGTTLAQIRHVKPVGRWWKYLSILSFSVLAVGVGLRAYRASESRSFSIKTVDEYWGETGLGPHALEDLIDDESCRSSQRYFLACANAVNMVADRLGLRISFAGVIDQAESAINQGSERRLLEPWKEFYSKDSAGVAELSFRGVWQNLVDKKMPENKKAALTGAALNAFLSVFRDPHTYILPIAYYQNVISRSNAPSSALGVVLDRSRNGYYLRKVMDGSPSEKAGLKRGDWIVSVNGHELAALPPQRLGELLKPENGEVTTIKVRRGREIMDIEIHRDGTAVPSVSWKRLSGLKPVGVLTLHKFAKDSCVEFKKVLSEMNEQGLKGLLIDLRDNSGGQMDEAACMISLFTGPKMPAFRIRYLDPSRDPEIYYGQEKVLWTGKVAILINNGTASAAEILAGSLHDHQRAILVGERTFGKGSFQEGEIWNRNRRVAFFQTKGFYYLPSGYSPQLRGLWPDVPVKFRDSLNLREEDQYVNPLRPPNVVGSRPMPIDMSACSVEASSEDPQLAQARAALFCSPVVAEGAVLAQ